MHKLITIAITLLLSSILMSTACCSHGNELPTASIDAITPDVAEEGEKVTFSGHGIDPDGYITGWRWTSNIDGLLSSVATFSEASLSAGIHDISFQVKDNASAWSEEVTEQLVIGATTGMEEAVTIVIEEILPDIDEIEQGAPYTCYKLERSLYNGTIIEEDTESGLVITLQEMIFFFYLDLDPGTEHPHNAIYILVDIDGNHDEYDASWLPSINGAIPEELNQTPPDETYVIARHP